MARDPSDRERLGLLEQRVTLLERAVYGLAGAILLAVIGALMSLVLRTIS